MQEAIWRVLDMQTAAGSFGMWGPYGGIVDWLSVYATDFLLQAKAKGKNVPEAQLRQAVTYLRSLAANDSGNAGAYALYVLAREGEANIGRLRQFHDEAGLTWFETFDAVLQVVWIHDKVVDPWHEIGVPSALRERCFHRFEFWNFPRELQNLQWEVVNSNWTMCRLRVLANTKVKSKLKQILIPWQCPNPQTF